VPSTASSAGSLTLIVAPSSASTQFSIDIALLSKQSLVAEFQTEITTIRNFIQNTCHINLKKIIAVEKKASTRPDTVPHPASPAKDARLNQSPKNRRRTSDLTLSPLSFV